MNRPFMEKQALRTFYKTLRSKMPEEKKRRCDLRIFEHLCALDAFTSAEQLLLYVSGGIEVDTSLVLWQALDSHRAVYVPRCSKTQDGVMEFYRIFSVDRDLEPGAFGVLEPIPSCERLNDLSHGLCIVPGLAYDAQGFRLGFGKGYYDRFLARFSGNTVGLCYDENIVGELPHGEFDRRIQAVVTQSGYHPFPIDFQEEFDR